MVLEGLGLIRLHASTVRAASAQTLASMTRRRTYLCMLGMN